MKKAATKDKNIEDMLFWLNDNHFNTDHHILVKNIEHIVFKPNVLISQKELIMLKEHINAMFKSAFKGITSQKLLFGNNEELISIDIERKHDGN